MNTWYVGAESCLGESCTTAEGVKENTLRIREPFNEILPNGGAACFKVHIVDAFGVVAGNVRLVQSPVAASDAHYMLSLRVICPHLHLIVTEVLSRCDDPWVVGASETYSNASAWTWVETSEVEVASG